MEENKKTTKKTTTKKATTTKKSTKKEEAKIEQPQVDMNAMFQMFAQFMNQMQQNVIVEEKKAEVVKNKKVREVNKKTKSYLRKERGEEDVLVRSVAGTVCFKSPKTGVTYNWLEQGDEEWLTIDEILQMETASKKFLHSPWLIVDDEEVNAILGISGIVESTDRLADIDEILEDLTIGEIEKLLNESTEDYKNTFAGIVMNKIKEEELRDSVLIRELGRILKVDFEMFK